MLKDFAKVFSGRLGQTIIGFGTLFILLRLMTKEDYGLLALVTSVSGVIAVAAQFGLSSGLSKLVNDAQIRAPETVAALFRRGLAVQFVLLLAIGLAGTVTAALVYTNEIGTRLPILAGIALFVVGTVSGEHYFRTARTLDLFGNIASLTLLMSMARLVGAVIPYWLTGEVTWSVFYYGALQALCAGIYLYHLLLVISEGKETQAMLEGGLRPRDYVSVALPFLVIASSNIIFSQISLLVLGKAHTLEAVAEYEVANRVVNFLRSPAIAFSFVISSRFGRAVASADERAVQNRLRTNAKVSLLGVPVAMGLFFCADWVLLLLAGMAYSDAVLLIQILSIYLVGAFIADSYSLSLDYSGLSYGRAWIVVTVAVLNIILSVWLVPLIGTKGAALAVTIATILQALSFIALIQREFGLNILDAAGWVNVACAMGSILLMIITMVSGVPVSNHIIRIVGLAITISIASIILLSILKENSYE